MGVDFDLESVPGIAVGVAHGTLGLQEIKGSAAAVWRLVEAPEIRVLWDLREAHFNLSADEICGLAEFIKQNSPAVELRTAFLVSKDFEFGLIRMYEVFREASNARTSVFRDWAQALAWLRRGAV